jgi:hypothetical protein
MHTFDSGCQQRKRHLLVRLGCRIPDCVLFASRRRIQLLWLQLIPRNRPATVLFNVHKQCPDYCLSAPRHKGQHACLAVQRLPIVRSQERGQREATQSRSGAVECSCRCFKYEVASPGTIDKEKGIEACPKKRKSNHSQGKDRGCWCNE